MTHARGGDEKDEPKKKKDRHVQSVLIPTWNVENCATAIFLEMNMSYTTASLSLHTYGRAPYCTKGTIPCNYN